MKKLALAMLALAFVLITPSTPNTTTGEMSIATPVQIDSSEFKTFWDGFFAEKMATYHIPGVVFVVVQDSEIVLAKGYGISDIDQQSPVSPDKTLFHLGSIAKLMTATAVMQLVERGELDLHMDVNRYLRDFQVDNTHPQPITLFHLLTHTSGLEQHGISTGARSADNFVPLVAYLQEHPPQRLMPPGEVIIYSSVGIAIAGQVLEDVTGTAFADYVQQYIFELLCMNNSSFIKPPDYPTTNAATGYRYRNGEYISYTGTYYSLVAPAGDFVSTGLDMASFMLAHLENGRLGEAQLLQPETIQYMQAQQFAHHPQLRGRAIGFSEWIENGKRAIFHDGGAPGFLSRVFLVPEHRLGFFVAYNNGSAFSLKQEVTSELLDSYFPNSDIEKELYTPDPNLDTPISISEFTGDYRDYELSSSNIGKLSTLLNQISVKSIDDQHIRVGSTEYSRVAPTLFQTQDRTSYATFREGKGEITHLLLDTAAFEKVNWYETQSFQIGLIVVFGLTFLIAVLSLFFTNLNTQPASLFRWYAGLISALNLVFLISLFFNLMSVMQDPWLLVYGLTLALKTLLIIPLVTSVLTLGLVVLAFLGWKYGYWSLIGRLYYTWVTIIALCFIPFLRYWNLLGWPQ